MSINALSDLYSVDAKPDVVWRPLELVVVEGGVEAGRVLRREVRLAPPVVRKTTAEVQRRTHLSSNYNSQSRGSWQLAVGSVHG